MDQYLPLVHAAGPGRPVLPSSARWCRGWSPPSGPRRPSSPPTSAASCPAADPPDRFPVRFYLVAMIFIIFDIEIIFLYPYAVLHRELGAFGVGEMAMFAVAVIVSFAYLIANGALDWGPAKRYGTGRRPEQLVSATRTSTTTIRKVGLEGRYADRAAARARRRS